MDAHYMVELDLGCSHQRIGSPVSHFKCSPWRCARITPNTLLWPIGLWLIQYLIYLIEELPLIGIDVLVELY